MGFIVIVGLNLYLAHILAERQGYRVYDQTLAFPALDRVSAVLRWVIWAAVLFAGYIVSQWGMTHWLSYLLARHATRMDRLTRCSASISASIYSGCPSCGFYITWHWSS